ncbi:MAG: lipoyl(octanoyl) transferase LipB [Candidatus Makana argininalis]
MSNILIFRQLNLQNYKKITKKMKEFSKNRNKHSYDEIWLSQHFKNFTKGKIVKNINFIKNSTIPLNNSSRGGKITFHGPGQQLIYFLLNLKKKKLKIFDLIIVFEKIIISTLYKFNIFSHSIKNSPGIYIRFYKICSIGISIIKGCSLYGLSFNIKMDMSPFLYIKPCGYENIKMTQISDLCPKIKILNVLKILILECIKFLKIKNYKFNLK